MAALNDNNSLRVQSYLFPLGKIIENGGGGNAANQSGAIGTPIYFQTLPLITSDGMRANYSSLGDQLGRPEQILIYKNSDNRGIGLRTTFVADGESDDLNKDGRRNNQRDEFWLQHQVHRLLALTKPFYDRRTFATGSKGGKYFAPPLVLFTHGVRFVCVPVVVESVTLTDPEGALIEGASALPQVVNVDINMKTSYPYGMVPGYLNLHKAFKDMYRTTTANINANLGVRRSFGVLEGTKELSNVGGGSGDPGTCFVLQDQVEDTQAAIQAVQDGSLDGGNPAVVDDTPFAGASGFADPLALGVDIPNVPGDQGT